MLHLYKYMLVYVGTCTISTAVAVRYIKSSSNTHIDTPGTARTSGGDDSTLSTTYCIMFTYMRSNHTLS